MLKQQNLLLILHGVKEMEYKQDRKKKLNKNRLKHKKGRQKLNEIERVIHSEAFNQLVEQTRVNNGNCTV